MTNTESERKKKKNFLPRWLFDVNQEYNKMKRGINVKK